ncbi:MAG: hypothetical protein U1E52_14550 [Geminicoccaceae bacterium]
MKFNSEQSISTWKRRDLLAGSIGAVAAARMQGLIGTPTAQAATGWNPSPRSGLPFWFGSGGNPTVMLGLMPAGRGVDMATAFEGASTFADAGSKVASNFAKAGWHRYLVDGSVVGLMWASSPFCSDARFGPPSAWPAGSASITPTTWLNTSAPPTYTGAETPEERTTKQRRVWQMAADGWLDDVWHTKMLVAKRDYFIRYGLTSLRIVLRAAHEPNLPVAWGNTYWMRSYNLRALVPSVDGPMVRQALGRYNDIFLNTFGSKQVSISSDYAYLPDQLWTYWCPLKETWGGFDSRLFCPDNARLVGPDYYDSWPASMTPSELAKNFNQRTKQGWPIGIAAWLEWAKSIGKPLAVGEWGVWTKAKLTDGSRPANQGWDNPVFIQGFLDFCLANAADIAFVSYFNVDNSPAADLPAHLIRTWPGMADNSVSCAFTPPGEVNRCSARALSQWMADHVS